MSTANEAPKKLLLFNQYLETTGVEEEELKQALAPIKGDLLAVVVMPAHAFDAPSDLLVQTRHYGEQAVLPRGLVLSVNGTLAIVAPSVGGETAPSNVHFVVNERSGFGVSAYAITSSTTQDDLEARFNRAKAERALPRIASTTPTHYISVTKYRQPDAETDSFAIVVGANDAPAAVKLMEMLAERPQTISELVESLDYRALLESSQKYRDELAAEMAAALGVEIDTKPYSTALSHYIVKVDDGRDEYKIYHDAFNTEGASTGAIVGVGATGGYVHTSSKAGGWRNETLSSMPTTTGVHSAALHKLAPVAFDESKVAFERTLPDQAHRLAASQHARLDEEFVQKTLERSAKGESSSKTEHTFIGGVVANVSTHHLSSKELLQLATSTQAKSIPVPVDHPIVASAIAAFDEMKARNLLPADYTLTQALSSEFSYENDPLLSDHSSHAALQTSITNDLAVDSLPTIATGQRPRGWRTYRRYRRGYGTALALDVAFLAALAALGAPPLYARRLPPRYYYKLA